jgi:ATP-dependent 26S proteasome regulatory subunit
MDINMLMNYMTLFLSGGLTPESLIKIGIMLLLFILPKLKEMMMSFTLFKTPTKSLHIESMTYCDNSDGRLATPETSAYYSSLLWHITKNIDKDENIVYTSNRIRGLMVIEYLKEIHIEKFIFSIESTRDKTQSDKYQGVKLTNLIKVTTPNRNELEIFLNDTYEKYLAHNNSLIANKYYIYRIIHTCDKQTSQVTYQTTEFKSTKSFNNLFFSQKQMLINKLDFFLNKKEVYKKVGMSHTLGIMLHGVPGSGKTSTIKAIAKYTNRHILTIPASIKNIGQLYSLFTNDTRVSSANFKVDKCILVFEEVDCGFWGKIFKSREHNPEERDTYDLYDSDLSDQEDKDDGPKSKVKYFGKKKPLITLGDFLEFIDGIIEQDGRIIIMTTNHPEHLDKALLRPGRIDLNLNLGRLTKEDVNNLYKLWFETDIPKKIFSLIKDHVFTQAELGQLFSSSQRDAIHTALIKTHL